MRLPSSNYLHCFLLSRTYPKGSSQVVTPCISNDASPREILLHTHLPYICPSSFPKLLQLSRLHSVAQLLATTQTPVTLNSSALSTPSPSATPPLAAHPATPLSSALPSLLSVPQVISAAQPTSAELQASASVVLPPQPQIWCKAMTQTPRASTPGRRRRRTRSMTRLRTSRFATTLAATAAK
jgi:hypothetical protein